MWDVRGMLAEMSWQQFMGWMGYAELEPFGEERDDARIAQLCALYANANRRKGTKAFILSDFMLSSLSAKHKRSTGTLRDPAKWKSAKAAWKSWAAAGGGGAAVSSSVE